jgi:MYXO-CTERM domain-containing protein
MFVGWITLALAQETPTALEVITLASESACATIPSTHVPDIVRTNIGIVQLGDDGTYTYGCPSRWGDDPKALVAVSSDGDTWLIVSSGAPYVSTDRGCGASPLTLPEGGTATAVLSWRGAFFLIVELPPGSENLAALYRWTEEDGFIRISSWADFVPDGMTPEDNDTLWLAGAGGGTQVRRLSLLGGLTGDAPLPGLPADTRDLERVVPVIADDGEVWLRVERRQERWLWHASYDGFVATFTTSAETWRALNGPVRLEDRWWITGDLSLYKADVGTSSWVVTDSQPGWTCLNSVGDRVFACTIPAMYAVIGIGPAGSVNAEEVFRMVEVGPPDGFCGASATCEADWESYGTAADIFDANQAAICPDGTKPEGSGCSCDSAPSPWLLSPMGLLALWRRRRTAR